MGLLVPKPNYLVLAGENAPYTLLLSLVFAKALSPLSILALVNTSAQSDISRDAWHAHRVNSTVAALEGSEHA